MPSGFPKWGSGSGPPHHREHYPISTSTAVRKIQLRPARARDLNTTLPNLPGCSGITFQLAYAAKHVGEIDRREEAHAPAG